MADLEKVIEWLGKCVLCEEPYCNLCPYHEHTACKHFIMRDALELLKSQQAEIAELKEKNDKLYRRWIHALPDGD